MRATPIALAATLAMTLAAAARQSDPSGPDVDKVTYLTSFSTFGRDAYVYVADEQGYFADAGIEVEIRPGSWR